MLEKRAFWPFKKKEKKEKIKTYKWNEVFDEDDDEIFESFKKSLSFKKSPNFSGGIPYYMKEFIEDFYYDSDYDGSITPQTKLSEIGLDEVDIWDLLDIAEEEHNKSGFFAKKLTGYTKDKKKFYMSNISNAKIQDILDMIKELK